MKETVFRLISVRPGVLSTAVEDLRETPIMDSPGKHTELYEDVTRAAAEGQSYDEIRRIVQRHKGTGVYLKHDEVMPGDLPSLLAWFATVRRKEIGSLNIADEIAEIVSQPLAEYVQSDRFRNAERLLANTVFADSIDGPELDSPANPRVSVALKLLVFLQRYASNADVFNVKLRLGDLIERTTIIVPRLTPGRTRSGIEIKQKKEPLPQSSTDVEHLDRLERVYREVTRIMRDDGNVVLDDECGVGEDSKSLEAEVNRLRMDVASLREADLDSGDAGGQDDLNAMNPVSSRPSGDIRLSRAARNRLSEEARTTLEQIQVDVAAVNPVRMVSRLEEEMEWVGSTLVSDRRRGGRLLMHGGSMDIAAFEKAVSPYKGESSASLAIVSDDGMLSTIGSYHMPMIATCKQSVGVGDLLMVKQTIKAYQVTEFAHVENVLAGESREREHRRLNVREEISTLETEREVEEERDLQSTTRNEMQNEVERTIKNEFGLEAGLQVSGSYGPSVSFTASLNTSISSSTEEAQRKATTFSREVTEKTSERIRERVREEQRRRVLEEIEETNRHKVENPDVTDGHIRGIYRWLNKIYDAQVLRYGQRMMFEFVVPEPAAFFLYALVDNAPDEMLVEKPEEPEYFGAPLKPSNLNRTNYHLYVSEYRVAGVGPPPPLYTTVTLQSSIDYTGDEVTLGRSGLFDIPDGYEAYAIRVHVDHVFKKGKDRSYRIMIGGQNIDATSFWGSAYRNIARTRNEISIAYELMDIRAYTLGADLYCELTTEGFEKWKLATYDAIMAAYLDQKAAYDEQLRAREIQEGIRILGRNPLENRRIERDELRKLVLRFITGGVGMGENVFYPFDEPVVDIAKACPWGKYVQFFENAFEWQNLMYVLYPYFWGRHARWVNALHLTDPDPDFAAFLKAGAARIQVPVRPGFEKAIAHYCQTGHIWNGGDPPLIDDDLYVPIVQEITENLGGSEEGVPYPEGSQPWEVTIPTSLILLQDLDEIPDLRDVLTGNPVDILNAD